MDEIFTLVRNKMFSLIIRYCLTFATSDKNPGSPYRSGQVWRNTPVQRVAASNLRRYYALAIAQADARPAIIISLR